MPPGCARAREGAGTTGQLGCRVQVAEGGVRPVQARRQPPQVVVDGSGDGVGAAPHHQPSLVGQQRVVQCGGRRRATGPRGDDREVGQRADPPRAGAREHRRQQPFQFQTGLDLASRLQHRLGRRCLEEVPGQSARHPLPGLDRGLGAAPYDGQLVAHRTGQPLGVAHPRLVPGDEDPVREFPGFLEPAPGRGEHRPPGERHHVGVGVAGLFRGADVHGERGLGGRQVPGLGVRHEAPEQAAALGRRVPRPAGLSDDLPGGGQAFGGGGRVPQRVQPAVEDLGDRARVAGCAGQAERRVRQVTTARQGRGVGQQLAREPGQHPGADRRGDRSPGGLLQQPDESEVEFEELGPRRGDQREVHGRVGVPGQALQPFGQGERGTGQPAGDQPQGVDGVGRQPGHERGEPRARQSAQPQLGPVPGVLTGGDQQCARSRGRAGPGQVLGRALVGQQQNGLRQRRDGGRGERAVPGVLDPDTTLDGQFRRGGQQRGLARPGGPVTTRRSPTPARSRSRRAPIAESSWSRPMRDTPQPNRHRLEPPRCLPRPSSPRPGRRPEAAARTRVRRSSRGVRCLDEGCEGGSRVGR